MPFRIIRRFKRRRNLRRGSGSTGEEVRSSYYPQANGSLTGVEAEPNSRIAAGCPEQSDHLRPVCRWCCRDPVGDRFWPDARACPRARIFHAQAQQENVVATRADVLLRVNQAYFGVLRAQAVLQVAEQTVKSRQLVVDQISALAKEQSQVRPGREFCERGFGAGAAPADSGAERCAGFVCATFRRARLLGSTNISTCGRSIARRSALRCCATSHEALQNRPELISQGFDVRSAQSFATAERDLWFPTISAAGVTGLIPYRQDTLASRYAAAGFNVNIPIFNGRLFNAQHTEATARARAQEQLLRDLQNRIARDVRTAWLNAISAYQRLSVTQQLLDQATQAFDLAKGRYGLGLSSIVELSQAQLNLTASADRASQRAVRLRKPNCQFELPTGPREVDASVAPAFRRDLPVPREMPACRRALHEPVPMVAFKPADSTLDNIISRALC